MRRYSSATNERAGDWGGSTTTEYASLSLNGDEVSGPVAVTGIFQNCPVNANYMSCKYYTNNFTY